MLINISYYINLNHNNWNFCHTIIQLGIRGRLYINRIQNARVVLYTHRQRKIFF